MKRDLYRKYQIGIDTNNNVVTTQQFVKVVNKLLSEIEKLETTMKQKVIRKGHLSNEEFETMIKSHFKDGWTFVGSITPSKSTGGGSIGSTVEGEIFVILQRNNL